MLKAFAAMTGQIASLKSLLDTLPPEFRESEQAACLQDMLLCGQLSLTLYAEANKAVQAGAWFAATVVAASALEATLLVKCLVHQAEVSSLPKCASLMKAHKGNFRAFARSMDLGKLLEIADQLSWFHRNGVPDSFVAVVQQHLDEQSMKGLLDIFRDQPDIGKLCSTHFRHYRNMVHPAVCLKTEQQPTEEGCQTATLLFLIAFSALGEGSS